jgi:hypothetical protein
VANFRLNLITNPHVNEPEDFEQLAEWIHAHDPHVDVVICRDEPSQAVAPDARNIPNLTFSPGPLRWYRPERGPVLQGQLLAKSAEYQRLDAIGIPVPNWALLTVSRRPDCAALGPYVVVKPDFGARGADVRIVKTSRLHWHHPTTRFARMLGGLFAPYIVQEFVYTGRWPASYRVVTLFGEVLWCTKIEASHSRTALASRFGFGDLGSGLNVSVVSSGKGCTFELANDSDIISLAEQAHRAFPDIGLLGVDVLRDVESGQLFVVEVNSLGYTWHFSSPSGRSFQKQFGLDLESQFDGRRKAARILARQTRLLAG